MIHRHIDFETGDLRELPTGVQGSGGGVVLEVSLAAAFPDRVGPTGGAGLRLVLDAGGGTRWLTTTMEPGGGPVHLRCLLGPVAVQGTAVTFMRGRSASGHSVLEVSLLGGGTLDLKAGSAEVQIPLPAGLAWHCVEVACDPAASTVTLSVNGGAPVAAAAADLSPITSADLGAIERSADVQGELYLDEWIVAGAPIGPVVAPPLSDRADDPRRWLVTYNAAWPDGAAWAEAYRAARNIPYANLCALQAPTEEQIDAAGFAALSDAVEAYLQRSGLAAQVTGVLVGRGMPTSVVLPDGASAGVASLLATPDPTGGAVGNPLFRSESRPTKQALGSHRLTARLDGATLADAVALHERAIALEALAGDDGEQMTLHLDLQPQATQATADAAAAIQSYLDSVEGQRLRLPRLDASAAGFGSIRNDGFYYGWREGAPAGDLFGQPAGRRALLVQADPAQEPSTTLRDTASEGWATAALAAGYTFVSAGTGWSVGEPPAGEVLLDRLRRGWSIAEAWHVSLPLLRTAMQLCGDPVARMNFPLAGWDVLGPAADGGELDPGRPIAANRPTEVSATLGPELWPAQGEASVIAVRRTDAAGSFSGLRWLQVGRLGDTVAAAPLAPAWPRKPGWRVAVSDGEVVLVAMWEQPMSLAGVTQVEFIGEVDGAGPALLAGLLPVGPQRVARVYAPLPTVAGRYRWRVTGKSGCALDGPWSQWLRPNSAEGAPALQVQEVTL